MGYAFQKSLLVDIDANPSAGYSEAYHLGGHVDELFVPASILCPSNLQGASRVKLIVSQNDSDYYDIYVDGAIVPLALTVDVALTIPEALQSATLGWAYVRLVTLNGSNVPTDPSADITFVVRFAPAQDVPGVQGLGGLVVDHVIIDAGTATIGIVDQGAAGASLWPVKLPATARVRATLAAASPGVIAAAGNYGAGDVLNDDVATGTYWVVPAAARANGLGGIIAHVLATCSVAAMVPRLRLHVYNVAPTVYQNDNEPLLKAIADRVSEVCEPILLDALQTVGSSTYSWAASGEVNRAFKCAAADDDLYFVAETLDAFTNEAAGMTLDFHFTIAQD